MNYTANPYSEQEIESIRREVAGALRGNMTLLTERWLDTVDALRSRIDSLLAERSRLIAALPDDD